MSERLGWYFAYLFQISGVNAVIVVKDTLCVWEKLEKTGTLPFGQRGLQVMRPPRE